jgi:Nuclease-related domain
MVKTRGKGEGYFTIAGYSAIGEGYRLLASTPYWQFKAGAALAVVFAAGVAARTLTSWALAAAVVAVGVAVAGLLRAETIRKQVADSWLKGGHGEQLTARRLARLPDSWHVFHDLKVPVPDSMANLDHVVVGPTGVFVIDSKAWSGRIHRSETSFEWLHDGYSFRDQLTTTEWEAEALGDALYDRLRGHGVQPTVRWLWCVHGVALAGGGVLMNDGTALLTPRRLVRWLATQPQGQLDQDQVEEVARALAGLAVPAIPRAVQPENRRHVR